MQSTLFDVIPGAVMPVSQVNRVLSDMWEPARGAGALSPADSRACQMTVVLHFGVETESADARARFEVAMRFARRYPCRVVVLCPERSATSNNPLDAKLFCQCYIGETLRNKCYCEAIALGYPLSEVAFIEDQLSLWVHSDLPLYYWFHRVPSQAIEANYLPMLHSASTIVYDSHLEGDSYNDIQWPHPARVSDIADSRVLPLRQCIGRFLGSYDASLMADGLKEVRVFYAPRHHSEAASLLRWQASCLSECGARNITYVLNDQAWQGCGTLAIEWEYHGGKKSFTWSYNRDSLTSRFEADWGQGPIHFVNALEYLSPEVALAEAFFF
jgi:hypothetical protein